jgi:hypothetical protein
MTHFGTKIVIENFGIWMDGGSIILQCRNEAREEFELYFMQGATFNYYQGMRVPGRVYLNDKLVEQRSSLEEEIVAGLSNATFESPDLQISQVLEERLQYITSEQYLKDTEKLVMLKLEDRSQR